MALARALGQHGARPFGTRAGYAHSRVPAREAQQRILAGEPLQAASSATAAGWSVGVDGQMAELAGEARRPAKQLAAQHHPGADPHLARDKDEVVQPLPRTLHQLGHGAEIGLVLDVEVEGRVLERLAQQVTHRDVGPAQVGCDHEPAVRVHQPRHGYRS